MVENVFVVGLNDHSAAILSRLPDADRYRFHQLLDSDVLLFSDTIPLPDLLAEAQQQVEAFDGPVHAIIGFWDFPVSTMVPMLCERLGLRWASLESVVKCEHKYWSRLEQRRVIDEYPRFGLVDLDDAPDPARRLALPGVGQADQVGLVRPRLPGGGRRAAAAGRERPSATGSARMGEPFDFVLSQLQLPPEVSGVGGRACLAEEAATGAQVTVEGYSFQGDVHVYGTVDSITCDGQLELPALPVPLRAPRRRDAAHGRALRAGHPADRPRRHHLQHRVLLGRRPRHDLPARGEPAPLAVARRAVRAGRRRRQPRPHAAARARPRAATTPRRGPLRRRRQVVRAPHHRRRSAPGAHRRGDRAGRARPSPAAPSTSRWPWAIACRSCTTRTATATRSATVYLGADDEDELIRKYEQALGGLPFEFEEPAG